MTRHECSVFRCRVSRTAHVVLILAACLYAVPAWAQADDEARALVLFEEGRALMAQQAFSEAAEKFEAAHQIFPGVGTLLNLGVARRESGQLIDAWTAFDRAADLARRTDDPRESYARELIDELAPRLYLLRIEVPEQARAPGLVIAIDGAPVSEARWNTNVAVSRGTHVIRAQRPGAQPFETPVQATTAGEIVEVVIPALAPEPAPAEVPASGPAMSALSAPGDDGAGMPMGRKVALGSAAVGALGLVAGSVLGLRARSQYDQAESACPVADAASCDMTERMHSQGLRNDARSTANLATISLAVGVAAGVTGAVLWFTSGPDDRVDQESARVLPLVAPGVAGVSVRLGF